jgi:hypothetical protein
MISTKSMALVQSKDAGGVQAGSVASAIRLVWGGGRETGFQRWDASRFLGRGDAFGDQGCAVAGESERRVDVSIGRVLSPVSLP